jgi:hypothetical protein
MADTPLAIEALVKRFGGQVCSKFQYLLLYRKEYIIIENTIPFGGTPVTTGLFVNGYLATVPFDAPNIVICSVAEFEAPTPSAELQAYKNMNVNL